MPLSEVKVLMLLKLIENGKITIDDIKDQAYKEEVARRLQSE